MKCLPKYIVLLLAAVLLLLLAGCQEDTYFSYEEENTDDKVRIELFTRATSYNIPLTRATADEETVGRTPWIFVFDNNAIFVEAVQAYEITSKIYVNLSRNNVDSKLLILTNTQDFSSTNFDTLLGGKTLSEACDLLLTEQLSGTQTVIPFIGKSIPMSYLLDVPGGIKDDTTIGTTASLLKMVRSIAKVIVKNSASNFTLLGITEANNLPNQGQLHNLSATPMTISTANLISYRNAGVNIADAVTNSTESNPLYLFESHIDNDSYVIIKGTYMGKDYYYKMALVDTHRNKMHILRNRKYIYTITKVAGEGHPSVEEARNAPAFNDGIVKVTLTVEDTSAYEITAFNNYYLAVSNSHYLVYNGESNLTAFKIIAAITDGAVTGEIIMPDGLTLANPSSNIINVTSSSGLYSQDVMINMSSAFSEGQIILKLGNLRKTITVKRDKAILGDAVLKMKENLGYYCVSGVVENALSWIKLHPSNWTSSSDDRNDTSEILVDDGEIQMEIEAGSSRTGTVYYATTKDPGLGGTQIETYRVKLDILQ